MFTPDGAVSACVLVAYASKHGSTREVAEAVADRLRAAGVRVDVRPASCVDHLDAYRGVVLGGALYTGRWHRDARRFLSRHRSALAQLTVAAFAVGPRTLEEADVASSRSQLDRALAHAPEVEPVTTAIFGGVVDPEKLSFPFAKMPASDARDWDAIDRWADGVAAALTATPSVA
jgi:menaquinone-dependent protoporphyrinogen oxidase